MSVVSRKNLGTALATMMLVATVVAWGGVSSLAGASSKTGNDARKGAIKAALIQEDTAKAVSYTEEGYKNFERAVHSLGSKVTSTVEETIPEGSRATQVVDTLIAKGYTLIFVNSNGYETYLKPVAEAHPKVRIEEFESTTTASNYGTYSIDLAESAYIAGMVMAAASKTGHLGAVASFPFSGFITQLNGIELGAKAINPAATLHVLFVSSFYTPTKEGQAASALIGDGADVLADLQTDATVCETAQSKNVPCVGQTLFNGPSYAPTTYLMDFRYNWTPIFKEIMKDELVGKPVPKSIFGTYKEGTNGVNTFGPAYKKDVSAADQAKIRDVKAKLRSGKFTAYTGPIKDQKGKLMVKRGHTLSASQIETITWAVKGVVGSVKS